MTPDHESLWTVAETARFLSMSKQWVYKHAELGTLPCLRMGAAIRFRPEAILRVPAIVISSSGHHDPGRARETGSADRFLLSS